jgi:hypothetical protein
MQSPPVHALMQSHLGYKKKRKKEKETEAHPTVTY